MKSLVIVLVVSLAGHVGLATEVEKLYYVGESQMSDASGKVYGSQVILLEKVLDPDHSIFVERAVVVKPDGKAEEFTMNHRVSGNSFTLDDTKGTLKGAGTLFGPEWKWTYWKGAFESTNGARIEDENFMLDPNVLVARKRISAPDGKVIGFMDITLKSITATTFTILSSSLLKKAQGASTEKKQ